MLLTILTLDESDTSSLQPKKKKRKSQGPGKPEQMWNPSLHHCTVPVVSSLALKMNLLFMWTKATSLMEIGTVSSQIVKSTSLLGKDSGDMSSLSTWGLAPLLPVLFFWQE